jgi:hypothetical protein
MTINIPSLEQIKRALHIQESIESLKNELSSIFGGAGGTGAKRGRKPGRKPGRPSAASASSAVEAGEEATSTKRAGKKAAKKKRVMSPEAREKIAAAQRKRWAKQKKAEK